MRGTPMLYVDQWGNRWTAKTVKDLKQQVGPGKVSRMYQDKTDGSTVHVGYVIGPHWCHAFVPYEGSP